LIGFESIAHFDDEPLGCLAPNPGDLRQRAGVAREHAGRKPFDGRAG